MISLRIPQELERKLDSLAKSKGKNRSEIIKDSILEYIKNHSSEKTPFDLGQDLFGKYSAGDRNLAKNRKDSLKEMIVRKNEKRRSN